MSKQKKKILYDLITFFYQLDDSAKNLKRQNLSTLVRCIEPPQHFEVRYQSLIYSSTKNKNEIVIALNQLNDQNQRFEYLLQAISLMHGLLLTPNHRLAIEDLVNKINLPQKVKLDLLKLFDKKDDAIDNCLSIGNDSLNCDIVKCQDPISASLLEFNSQYYFVSWKSLELIRIDENPVFDFVVYHLSLENILFIKNHPIVFSDIILRIDLKAEKKSQLFSIMKNVKSNNKAKYYLLDEDKEDCIGQIFLKACHILVINKKNKETVSIGPYKVKQNIYSGSIDDQIIIDNDYLFDLSNELPFISFIEGEDYHKVEKIGGKNIQKREF